MYVSKVNFLIVYFPKVYFLKVYCKYASTLGPNFFDPKVTQPTLVQTERTLWLAHLTSFCELFYKEEKPFHFMHRHKSNICRLTQWHRGSAVSSFTFFQDFLSCEGLNLQIECKFSFQIQIKLQVQIRITKNTNTTRYWAVIWVIIFIIFMIMIMIFIIIMVTAIVHLSFAPHQIQCSSHQSTTFCKIKLNFFSSHFGYFLISFKCI